MNVLGLDHLVLRTADAERLARFYAEALGCRMERQLPELGLVQLRAGASLIDLVTLDGPLGRAGGAAPGAGGRNLDHYCLRVEPFDEAAIRRRLAAAGAQAGEVATRYGAEGFGPSLYFADPDGNTVELKGPPTSPARPAAEGAAPAKAARAPTVAAPASAPEPAALPELYAASVPVLGRYLRRLAAMLALAERHAAAQGLDPSRLLQARLAPTMLPLARQVVIAANFAPRAVAPLAGLAPPDRTADDTTFAGLQRHVAQTLQWLDALAPDALRGAEHRRCEDRAGEAPVSLPARDFLLQYALPNFLFHLTTAYALLRHEGVPLGKADFDGFHVYAGTP